MPAAVSTRFFRASSRPAPPTRSASIPAPVDLVVPDASEDLIQARAPRDDVVAIATAMTLASTMGPATILRPACLRARRSTTLRRHIATAPASRRRRTVTRAPTVKAPSEPTGSTICSSVTRTTAPPPRPSPRSTDSSFNGPRGRPPLPTSAITTPTRPRHRWCRWPQLSRRGSGRGPRPE